MRTADENRLWPPLGRSSDAANFASVNRGKRKLVLDLKHPAAREVLLRLMAQADVRLHGFVPDTATRLGISVERLRAYHLRLCLPPTPATAPTVHWPTSAATI